VNSPKKSSGMTMADLKDWLLSNGCEVSPLPKGKATVLRATNPKNGETKYLYPPYDKPLFDYTVYNICCGLGIQIPKIVEYMKQVHDKIKRI